MTKFTRKTKKIPKLGYTPGNILRLSLRENQSRVSVLISIGEDEEEFFDRFEYSE